MTNLDKLRIIGSALHGPRWMRATARALGINYRTVLRWDTEEFAPSDDTIRRLVDIARDRGDTISEAINAVHRLR